VQYRERELDDHWQPYTAIGNLPQISQTCDFPAGHQTCGVGGTDWYAVMRQHVEDTPPAPTTLNPALSRGTEALILRCLAKAPADAPWRSLVQAALSRVGGEYPCREMSQVVVVSRAARKRATMA